MCEDTLHFLAQPQLNTPLGRQIRCNMTIYKFMDLSWFLNLDMVWVLYVTVLLSAFMFSPPHLNVFCFHPFLASIHWVLWNSLFWVLLGNITPNQLTG